MNLLDIQQTYFQRITQTSDRDKITSSNETPWKILIFDDMTYNIVSNFKVGDLREANITLHLHINDAKSELSGVDAIYFITPSRESIDKLLQDLKASYFEEIYLNFCSLIEKDTFDYFIEQLIKIEKATSIKRVSQFNMDFYLINQRIFSANVKNCFMNDSEVFVDTVAKKLLDFIFFTGNLPIVIYDPEIVKTEQIFNRLKETFGSPDKFRLPDIDNLKNDKRTVLLLNANSYDTNPFLARSFKYCDLIVEQFGLYRNQKSLNKIKVGDEMIQIDTKSDEFWQRNAFLDFPYVSENISEEVEVWKEKYDNITLKPTDKESTNFAQKFSEALESLPQITEQKKVNQCHINIATNLMRIINEKELERLCVISSDIIMYKKISKDHAVELDSVLRNTQVEVTDKIRLLLLILTNTDIDIKKFEHYENAVYESSQVDSRYKALVASFKSHKFKTSVENSGLFTKLKNKSKNVWKNIVSQNYKFAAANLVNDIFKKKDVLEKFRVQQLIPNASQFLLNKVEHVIVFNIDGGNLLEYSELNDVGKQLEKEVYYGFSGLLTGTDVIKALSKVE